MHWLSLLSAPRRRTFITCLSSVIAAALGWSCLAGSIAAADAPASIAPLVTGLKHPESVALARDGRMFVSVIGEFDKDGDGAVMLVSPGKAVPYATGLDDPKGLVCWREWVFVADKTRVVRIDPRGIVYELAGPRDFPHPPQFLNDLAIDERGTLYVSDCGDRQGGGGAIYKISTDRHVTTVADHEHVPALKVPNGLLIDGPDHLLVIDFLSGELHRVSLSQGTFEKLAEGFPGGDGLIYDLDGNLYVSQWSKGRVSVLPSGSRKAILISDKFQSAADLGIDLALGHLLVPDMKAGTISTLPFHSDVPTAVDTSPLAVRIEPAFENLSFDRPLVLTHGGDGSRRIYVAEQRGRVFAFPDDPSVSEPQEFFDMRKLVRYTDNENEEGFLGLALHPRFKDNGHFFVFYTTKGASHTSVLSRFTADGPEHATARRESEVELLRIPKPFWNHNGGTIAFGPDGYLYIGLGDGGFADDQYQAGQDLDTLLGKILRIDVDHAPGGKKYGIPKDNPFVGQADAKPEIYAYGVRNIWRLSFDRQRGTLWAGDVGQNIWEEIDLIVPGGNYGWNRREGMHRFRPEGSGPRADLIEPIWEYHHDIGKSITGGHVYRGQRVPELVGSYLYADYVSGRVWALKYDDSRQKVVSNRSIAGNIQPVMSFGEDEAGEVYFMTVGGHLYRFASGK